MTRRMCALCALVFAALMVPAGALAVERGSMSEPGGGGGCVYFNVDGHYVMWCS